MPDKSARLMWITLTSSASQKLQPSPAARGTFLSAGPAEGAHTPGMSDDPRRTELTPAQVTLMHDVLADAPRRIKDAADRIGRGEVVPDPDAEAVVGALADAMAEDYSETEGLSARGLAIDEFIGIVQQMSEHFYG